MGRHKHEFSSEWRRRGGKKGGNSQEGEKTQGPKGKLRGLSHSLQKEKRGGMRSPQHEGGKKERDAKYQVDESVVARGKRRARYPVICDICYLGGGKRSRASAATPD